MTGPAKPVLGTGFRIAALAAFVVLMALGIWQVCRLQWKLDLIEQVNARVAAPAIPAPGPTVTAVAYTHVQARGHFLNDKTTYAQATTNLGMGFWVLTPLVTDQGITILINRGFTPTPKQEAQVASATITGLLRLSEPKGRWLRPNIPAQDRWYSRDVAAIAEARNLQNAAPYFIDADVGPDPDALPRGGLTVVSFANNHLQYALTWFGMALALLVGVAIAARSER